MYHYIILYIIYYYVYTYCVVERIERKGVDKIEKRELSGSGKKEGRRKRKKR